MSKLILASGSPRRKDLLLDLGLQFTVEVPDVDESIILGESPAAMVKRLSILKAKTVADRYPDKYVLGSDTTVALGKDIFGKPVNRDDARFMLEKMSGSTHTVYTAFAILNITNNILITDLSACYVRFANLNAADIENYLDVNEYQDKAGSYAFQGKGSRFIEAINGSPSAIVGLDIAKVYEALKKLAVI